MKKLSTILCPPLLVVLVGWLGVAQPVAAQQTVTLSGRVADTAGQAVPGAFVALHRLSDYIDGQETDANGAYRLSVVPGSYQLGVDPQRGPFIAQRQELRLSTDITRNVVLETGVTLSGRVTGPNDQPVSRAYLSVRNAAGQEVGFGLTNASGHYSLGAPSGTYQVEVFSEAFPDTTVEGVALSGDTVLNITLDSGVLLEGKVVDDEGQPVSGARVCAQLPAEQWWEGTCSETGPEGRFQLNVAPEVYVVTATPVAPLHPTRRRLEVGQAEVTALVLPVSRQPLPFVPDDPPKAALIGISAPTADGEVTLSGAAGSVPPQSAVVAITLDTGHFTTAQATADGNFTATLFAPAGTSVLIKADPVGTTVAQFMDIVADSNSNTNFPPVLATLPGTIVRVADPPGAGIPIGGAGRVHWNRLPAWTFRGSLNTHTLVPGDPLRVQGTVQVDSPVLQGTDMLQVHTTLWLERADGQSLLHGTSGAATTFLTPTGLPLERWSPWWAAIFGQSQDMPLVKTASTQAEAEIHLALTLPADLPAGYYRPFLSFIFSRYAEGASSQPPISQYLRTGLRDPCPPHYPSGASRSIASGLGALIGYAQQRVTGGRGRGRRRPLWDRPTDSDDIGNVCNPLPGCSLGPPTDLSPRTVCPDREPQ